MTSVNNNINITFSSCFYVLKSKFPKDVYIEWMNNFISIVHNFYLVIYTDAESCIYINTLNNPNIKVIIKPIEEFYNYKYKNQWIKNHNKNDLLNNRVIWEVNMLWSEKIWFVRETIQHKYFNTEFYGWCDIGYFRNGKGDIHTSKLMQWPNPEKVAKLNKDKIYYACVANDNSYVEYLRWHAINKNSYGLPANPIPSNQNSIAGGFFILHKEKIYWWCNTYEQLLKNYFDHDYLVKDDQIILADCIFTQSSSFQVIQEKSKKYDNWFLFQRYLL